MNIPDPMLYASIPVIGGAILWGARMFVQEQSRREKQEEGQSRKRDEDRETAAAASEFHLSARDWLNIVGAIEKTFNGRYWLEKDGRAAMAEIQRRSEEQYERLHERISKLREDLLRGATG